MTATSAALWLRTSIVHYIVFAKGVKLGLGGFAGGFEFRKITPLCIDPLGGRVTSLESPWRPFAGGVRLGRFFF